MKEEKDIARMDFAEYLRKSDLSENRKVYWTERYCYISKRRWDMCNILKSPLATAREMKVEMDDQSFLQEEPLLRPCFIKGAVFISLSRFLITFSHLGLSKWIHFQHVLSWWGLQQIMDMPYVKEIAEKFLSTLLKMFISSCYFI